MGELTMFFDDENDGMTSDATTPAMDDATTEATEETPSHEEAAPEATEEAAHTEEAGM